MPLPAGVETVTVSSGKPLTLPDGTVMRGKLLFTGPDVVTIAGQDVVLGGAVEVDLIDGEFSVRLVATDATGMSPTGWTYTVTAVLVNAPSWVRYISLPKATPSVALADVVIANPVTGTFATLADASTFVALTGDQVINGAKTFASIPVLPSLDPANDNQAVRKGYAERSYVHATAWRRRDLPDPLLADALSTETPTITVTQQSTSTISGAQALLTPDTGPFQYLGAGAFQYGSTFPDTTLYLPTSRYPNSYSSGQSNWSVEFSTDAAQFEIMFKYISAATMYRLTVDGRPMTDLAQATGATAAGSRHVLKFVFSAGKPRRIRFDLTTMPFGGLYLPSGATAWKPVPRGGRLGVLGDSITDGSAQNAGAGIGTWTYRLGRLLGCTDVWDQSRGGTGYITPGSYAVLGDRVASDIAPYNFDRLIVSAGYNDSSGSQSAISAAASSLYTALKALSPQPDITVIGCWSPTGNPAASITNTDNTLKAAAAAAGLPFISPVTGSVYDAAGSLVATQGAWITTANAGSYIGADAVHPTDAGHVYLSRRIAAALTALMAA